MSLKKKQAEQEEKIQEEMRRTRFPRNREVVGILEERLGGSRSRVRCFDNKTRICRIPGRLKRRLWVRPGDVVLVEPWELGGDAKGDIIFKYRRTQIKVLQDKGLMKETDSFDEF